MLISSLHVCVNISTPNIHGRNGCSSKSWVIDALLYAFRVRAIIYIAPVYVRLASKQQLSSVGSKGQPRSVGLLSLNYLHRLRVCAGVGYLRKRGEMHTCS